MDNSFVTMSDLEYRIANLKRELAAFKTGEKYVSMQDEYARMLAHEERMIRKVTGERDAAYAQVRDVREKWYATCTLAAEESSRIIKKKDAHIKKLEDNIQSLKSRHAADREKTKSYYEGLLEEKDAVIDELKNKLAHYEALLDTDGTNSGLPTSQTPVNKKKIIPNTRKKSGRQKGGQPGHVKHVLMPPADDEVTHIEEHKLGDDDICCSCGSAEYEYTGETDDKYVYDVEVEVKKIRHIYYIYRCTCCGQLLRTEIEPGTGQQCQYGPVVQALALSLGNTVNSPFNKTAMFINGMTSGELSPCEGYIAKLQSRAAKALSAFMRELKKLLITRTLIYWDDTVIMIMTKRGCLRFYGDESIAYYTAHSKKDLDSLEEDKLLELLTCETKVMHDHNTVNYNEMFHYQNIECNQHLQRDLKKSAEETGHGEFIELKDLISETVHERNEMIMHGEKCFPDAYIQAFNDKVNDIMERAEKRNEEDFNPYAGPFEKRIINRMKKYKDYYFGWLKDFSLPTTNNLSERALRCVKSHMKISGQFSSEETAGFYATIKSYIETCRRNNINEVDALTRLSSGNPYTVREIFHLDST